MSDYERGVRDERERIISLLTAHKDWAFDMASVSEAKFLDLVKEAENYVEAIEKIRGE